MRHLSFGLLAAAAFVSLSARPASAGQQDFTLLNKTGYQINEVYVSRSSSKNWGADVMGSDSLDNGQSVDISFTAPDNGCQWDMKVKYDDGDEAVWNALNLCKVNKVTLFWDRKANNTRAVTE